MSNGLLPSRNRLGYAIQDDGLTEDGTSKNVADCAVRAPPHLLQVELLYTSLIGGNGCTFDTDTVLNNGIGGVYGDLVVRLQDIGVVGQRSEEVVNSLTWSRYSSPRS